MSYLTEVYEWKEPVHGSGGPQGFDRIRFYWVVRGLDDKGFSRYELNFSSGAIAEMEVDENVKYAAVSFDNPKELVVVIDPPKDIPHYPFRKISNQRARMITNKDLVRYGVEHFGHIITQSGYLELDRELIGEEDGMKFWKLTAKENGFVDESLNNSTQ